MRDCQQSTPLLKEMRYTLDGQASYKQWLKFEVNINYWRMSQIKANTFYNPSQGAEEIGEKSAKFHHELRERYVERYKAQVRQ